MAVLGALLPRQALLPPAESLDRDEPVYLTGERHGHRRLAKAVLFDRSYFCWMSNSFYFRLLTRFQVSANRPYIHDDLRLNLPRNFHLGTQTFEIKEVEAGSEYREWIANELVIFQKPADIHPRRKSRRNYLTAGREIAFLSRHVDVPNDFEPLWLLYRMLRHRDEKQRAQRHRRSRLRRK